MNIIYNLLLCPLLVLLWPGLLWYMHRRQGSLAGLGERLGCGWPQLPYKTGNTWFHGASVGEIQMLVPLVRAWQERYPECGLLLTAMTLTGRQTAIRLFPEALVVLLPLDLPGMWALFFRHFKPDCLIIAETELWPNLLAYARRQEFPVALVNARLSEKSFSSYRFFRFFTSAMFATPRVVVVQDRVSGQRFAEIGTAAQKIVLSGNMKFDLLPFENSGAKLPYRNLFGAETQVVVDSHTNVISVKNLAEIPVEK